METFKYIHLNKKGKVSDKWESYLDYYDEAFSLIRDKELSILEIGVQNGGSLEVYNEYFKNVKSVVGCDISPKCGDLKFDSKNIEVVVGDIKSDDVLKKITSISETFDIIIDDGSHISSDIIIAFLKYFSLLNPGGIFVVEDTHALYQAKYGGGILNENSAINFFKKLAEITNYQWWSKDISLNNYLLSFFPNKVPLFIFEGWIESVEFRNSIITIRKSLKKGHEKLGNRLTMGNEMSVRKLKE